MNHLTPNQLQEYADGIATDRNDLEVHLRTCTGCSGMIEELRKLGTTIGTLPLDRVSPNFTERVMKQLGIREAPSFAWTVLKNLAPLVAMGLVIVVLFLALKWSGAFQGSGVQQSVEVTQSAYNKISDGMAAGINALNGWIGKYFSFAFAKSTYGMTIFLVLFFGFIAILDKYFLSSILKRKF